MDKPFRRAAMLDLIAECRNAFNHHFSGGYPMIAAKPKKQEIVATGKHRKVHRTFDQVNPKYDALTHGYGNLMKAYIDVTACLAQVGYVAHYKRHRPVGVVKLKNGNVCIVDSNGMLRLDFDTWLGRFLQYMEVRKRLESQGARLLYVDLPRAAWMEMTGRSPWYTMAFVYESASVDGVASTLQELLGDDLQEHKRPTSKKRMAVRATPVKHRSAAR
jgi:hypothetical protein